jgi:signal transduction histidine kinase
MAENLEHLEQNRKAMMADIAHELRNPLATMQFRLDALEDGVLPLETKEIATLQDQLGLLSRLVEDLRILSLADTGQLSLEKRALDLVALCQKTIGTFSSKAQQYKIDLEFQSTTEEALIYADPDRLSQVLGNLLDNAFKATPEGGWIKLLLEPHDQVVDISVRDSGRGIPEDVLPSLFERFVQGKRRDTTHKGSGLGLAIAYTLVRLHGGELHASNHAEGAQLRLRLPQQGYVS